MRYGIYTAAGVPVGHTTTHDAALDAAAILCRENKITLYVFRLDPQKRLRANVLRCSSLVESGVSNSLVGIDDVPFKHMMIDVNGYNLSNSAENIQCAGPSRAS